MRKIAFVFAFLIFVVRAVVFYSASQTFPSTTCISVGGTWGTTSPFVSSPTSATTGNLRCSYDFSTLSPSITSLTVPSSLENSNFQGVQYNFEYRGDRSVAAVDAIGSVRNSAQANSAATTKSGIPLSS